jgi:hypothetical protein
LLTLLAATAGAQTAVTFAVCIASAAVALAAFGRRDGAARVVPATVCFYAPLWVFERAVTVYRAVWARVVRGGCSYGGRMIARGMG